MSFTDVKGTRSDGLRIKVFPHTVAYGNIHSGTIAGKLNGVMPAVTPRGNLRKGEKIMYWLMNHGMTVASRGDHLLRTREELCCGRRHSPPVDK